MAAQRRREGGRADAQRPGRRGTAAGREAVRSGDATGVPVLVGFTVAAATPCWNGEAATVSLPPSFTGTGKGKGAGEEGLTGRPWLPERGTRPLVQLKGVVLIFFT